MSDYAISRANLNEIELNLGNLNRKVVTIGQNVEVISGQVEEVDLKVNTISEELRELADEFRAFADEAKRVAALADAKQTVVMLEQQLEKEFGHYETVRRHTIGILQASDISVVRKETIATATEELMLKAPRYWLAPALIALSAWLCDNKELADRALKEAIRRDDEKTSLLFCLISRRAGRLDGSLIWLERYFAMQDPAKMEDRIVVVLDAFASGLFGGDLKGSCSSKIKAWLDELSSRAGFVERQREQWSSAILGKKVFMNGDEYSYLKENSPTWEKLKSIMEWAKTHENIHNYFSNIFNAKVNNMESLAFKVDEILDNLVKNYDNEELPIRKELRRNRLVIEENGITDRATQRFESEEKAYETYSDFSQHLTDTALNPEKTGALIATQKLAISLSKDWIIDAYEDLTAKSRTSIPVEIEIKISEWQGTTRDGSNEVELISSLDEYVDKIKKESIERISWFSGKIVIALIVAAVVSILGMATVVIPILAIVGGWIYIRMEKKKAEDRKKDIENKMEEFRKSAKESLKAIIAEVVDFRKEYSLKDLDYNKVIDFLTGLLPEQYTGSSENQKVRQVL